MKNKAEKILGLIGILLIIGFGLGAYALYSHGKVRKNHSFSQRSAISTDFIESLKDRRPYHVKHVLDGDTFEVSFSNEIVTVRMIGIDTPETVDPRKPVQCFGREASDTTKDLLASSTEVYLETDPTQDMTDKYGRLLAYTTRASDGLFLNRYLVNEGYAREYTYGIPYTHQAEFKEAEGQAREAKKGLWNPKVCAQK